jgi:elongation factor Ts
MECKRALEEAQGNVEQAKALLREWGASALAKKADREASEGVIETYLHHNARVGVLVELNCETDFVARNEEFRQFANFLAKQIAAMNPTRIGNEADAPVNDPDDRPLLKMDSIVPTYQGRTVEDIFNELVLKLRENIVIRRFVRFELGA